MNETPNPKVRFGALNSAKRFLQHFVYILGPKTKSQASYLIGGFFFLTCIELIGIALIGSFVSVAIKPDSYDDFSFLISLSDQLGLTSQYQMTLLLGLVIIAIFLFKAVSSLFVNRAIFSLSFAHQKYVKNRLLSAYLRLPLVDALRQDSASLLTTIHQHAAIFTNREMIPLLSALSELLFMVLLFLFFLFRSPLVTLALVALILVIAYLYDHTLKNRVMEIGKQTIQATRQSTKIITQVVDGYKEIRVLGVPSFFLSQFDRYTDIYRHASVTNKVITLLPRYVIESLVVILIVTFLLIGLALNGNPSGAFISTVATLAFAAIRSMSSISLLLSTGNSLRFGRPAMNDLYAALHKTEEDFDHPVPTAKLSRGSHASTIMPFEHQVCFEGVSYRYPGRNAPAADHIDLCIAKGDSIGILGSSGSGKTTLVDLLLGLLQPDAGRIRVDGKDIAENLRAWMDRVAYIPQDIFLLDDTIAANIALGISETRVDQARLRDAVAAAQLDSLITSLPKGLQTMVGERGARLSGGQRQRIALARALYRRRDIMVMDEATSALDPETESEVVESIRLIRGKVTVIVIAHRLTTLRYCDTVIRLEAGHVVETGSYADVLGRD